MSIPGFLAKALSGSLIKVNVNNSKNIHISGNSIQMGDSKITDPIEVQKIQTNIARELKKHESSESYPINIIHKDRIDEFENLKELTIKEKESLKELKNIFGNERIKPIILAKSIHLAIEKKKPKELIAKLINQLERDFPYDGKKILNLISAKYFDELIIPMIDVCKEQNPDNYKEKFNEFFDSILRFFPTAIFVNNETPERKIIEEINKRLRLRNIPYIKIHAIGNSNIKRINRALKKFKSPTKFLIETNNFSTTTGLHAQATTLKIIKNNGTNKS